MEKLFNVPPELWKVLGTELGIDMEALNAIEREHSGDRDCLHAMVDSIHLTCGVMKRVLRTQKIISGPTVAGKFLSAYYFFEGTPA